MKTRVANTIPIFMALLLPTCVFAAQPVAQPQPDLFPTDPSVTVPTTNPVVVISTTRPAAPTTRPAYKVVRGHEGFWRLGQTPTGVWWFVSPEGKQEFLNAVTTVQPYQTSREKDGPEFVSRDFDGKPREEGNLDTWAGKTVERVRDAGFKSLGAWCNPAFHKHDIPITRDLNLTQWMKAANLKFYSPEWAPLAERTVKLQVEPLRDNRWLVGYYSDNELDWSDAGMGPALHFDNLPAQDENRQQVMRVMRNVWTDLAAFNGDWKTSLAEWTDLDGWKTLPPDHGPAYARLASNWLLHLATDYFKLTTELIHKYDPNHLILGVRFRGSAPTEVLKAARNFTDAQSINVYPADARLDADTIGRMYQHAGQPIIISEYAFHSLDGRSGNRNTFGFAAQVLDQQARADGYRIFTTRLARVPYIIGADWFQWMDEPPTGRSADGEDVNFGIVDIDDKPYDLLVDSIRKTTPTLNPLHAASDRDDQKDIWRESFANKPAVNVPFLTTVPKLKGELSGWPANSRLKDIRHSYTIGLDRSPLPLPNVYLGWTWDGLYIGMEVFDNDIQAAPPKGWWWTRDCVEFFISTRPVTSDQEEYSPFCHQFFFVPSDFACEGHYIGCVGQWHRPGDAIKDHLIPHPTIKQATRILADRYVLEMFIPAGALNGWDPKNQPAMAFNLHVRNFQHALDYFWSAPKEALTQNRPCTWGSLYLQMPGETTAKATPAPAAAATRPAMAISDGGPAAGQ